MQRSDYDYDIVKFDGRKCLVIEDLNRGGMSVTNNIEEVVREIAQQSGVNPYELMIVYRDSDGVWDGWDPVKKIFVFLGCKRWKAAISKYILIQLYEKQKNS